MCTLIRTVYFCSSVSFSKCVSFLFMIIFHRCFFLSRKLLHLRYSIWSGNRLERRNDRSCSRSNWPADYIPLWWCPCYQWQFTWSNSTDYFSDFNSLMWEVFIFALFCKVIILFDNSFVSFSHLFSYLHENARSHKIVDHERFTKLYRWLQAQWFLPKNNSTVSSFFWFDMFLFVNFMYYWTQHMISNLFPVHCFF